MTDQTTSSEAQPSSPSGQQESPAGSQCDQPTRSSEPYPLAAIGGSVFFVANDGVRGRGLWKSDGTRTGTALVKDISPDSSAGYYMPGSLTAVGGETLFLTADDGEHGPELWTSDGTKSGTVMVKDIGPPGFDYAPGSLTAAGKTLFFTADDGDHGIELWKSDGTESGTVMVKDIGPGERGYDYEYYYGPQDLTPRRGTLFFTAFDREHGRSLWKSDGTESGTVLVKDMGRGSGYAHDSRSLYGLAAAGEMGIAFTSGHACGGRTARTPGRWRSSRSGRRLSRPTSR